MLVSGAASLTPSTASTGYDIDNSLRFNDDDSAYLSRTFSAGNQKTWLPAEALLTVNVEFPVVVKI